MLNRGRNLAILDCVHNIMHESLRAQFYFSLCFLGRLSTLYTWSHVINCGISVELLPIMHQSFWGSFF